MSKIVFLFSGQGSQYQGMGIELLALAPNAENIVETGSKITGLDLKHLLTTADDSELAQTKNAQPAILTMSLLALDVAKSKGIPFEAVAGHSLGEYAAMYAADVLSLEDVYTAIKHRSIVMEKAAAENPGAMAAILGSDEVTVGEICAEIVGYVVPVNYNSSAQTVIAGDVDAVDMAVAKFAQLGKKAVKLAVSAAFHSKLMQSAADAFKPLITDLTFNQPTKAFYSNLYGDMLPADVNFSEYLSNHIISPVKFTSELAKLSENGYDTFIELGPNKVLTGLVKKTLKGVTAVNIENEKTLIKAVEALIG